MICDPLPELMTFALPCLAEALFTLPATFRQTPCTRVPSGAVMPILNPFVTGSE